MLVNSPLSSINESIFIAKTPISLPLQLPVFLLKRNLKKRANSYLPKVKGLGVKLIFNKNIIKLGDNIKYIKEAVNTIVILYIK